MKVKIISTTNPNIQKYLEEIRRYFKIYDCACFEDCKTGHGIRTSRIINETIDGNIITLETKNSVYKLEVVEEEKEDGE